MTQAGVLHVGADGSPDTDGRHRWLQISRWTSHTKPAALMPIDSAGAA
jgi:hypothetical protein